MTQTKAEPKRPGRPTTDTPKRALGGKGRLLSANISQETREALEKEAETTGRSISQIADQWLEEARNGRAQYLQLLGGSGRFAGAVERLALIARTVSERVGDHNSAEIALRAAWLKAIPKLFPMHDRVAAIAGTDPSAPWKACHAALLAVEEAGADDPVFRRALEPLRSPGGPLTSSVVAARLIDVLSPSRQADGRFLAVPDSRTVDALEALKVTGHTASAEIDHALKSVRSFIRTSGHDAAWVQRAAAAGEEIAGALVGGAK